MAAGKCAGGPRLPGSVHGVPWGALESTPSPGVDGTGTVFLGRLLSPGRLSGRLRARPGRCLTISLARAGIFLETRQPSRRLRAGKAGRQADRRAGMAKAGPWCLVLGPVVRLAAGEATPGGMSQSLHLGFHPHLEWGHLVTSHPLPWEAVSPGGLAGSEGGEPGGAGPCGRGLPELGTGLWLEMLGPFLFGKSLTGVLVGVGWIWEGLGVAAGLWHPAAAPTGRCSRESRTPSSASRRRSRLEGILRRTPAGRAETGRAAQGAARVGTRLPPVCPFCPPLGGAPKRTPRPCPHWLPPSRGRWGRVTSTATVTLCRRPPLPSELANLGFSAPRESSAPPNAHSAATPTKPLHFVVWGVSV